MNSVKALPSKDSAQSIQRVVDDLRDQILERKICVDRLMPEMISAIEASNFNYFTALVAASSALEASDRSKVLNLFATFVEGCLAEGQSDLALKVENLLYPLYLKKLETEPITISFLEKLVSPTARLKM